MQGKTVRIGEEESGTEQNALQILEGIGLGDRLAQLKQSPPTEAADALQTGEFDVMFFTAGVANNSAQRTAPFSVCFVSKTAGCTPRQRLPSAYPPHYTHDIQAEKYFFPL
ncbi:MAG: TAXI family TRAP transporter solute-binding subunit [Lachnospiraceae bacterium]